MHCNIFWELLSELLSLVAAGHICLLSNVKYNPSTLGCLVLVKYAPDIEDLVSKNTIKQ